MMRASMGIGMVALLLSSAVAAQEHAVHWGYDGEGGPEHWGALSPEYAVCATGREQSPIDFHPAAAISAELDDLAIAYAGSGLHILNNGHTIQVNVDEGSTLTIGGVSYALRQFHYHAPSE